MEVNEVKKKQQELKSCVEHLLRTFYDETGCLVDVRAYLERVPMIGASAKPIPRVSTEVSL